MLAGLLEIETVDRRLDDRGTEVLHPGRLQEGVGAWDPDQLLETAGDDIDGRDAVPLLPVSIALSPNQ